MPVFAQVSTEFWARQYIIWKLWIYGAKCLHSFSFAHLSIYCTKFECSKANWILNYYDDFMRSVWNKGNVRNWIICFGYISERSIMRGATTTNLIFSLSRYTIIDIEIWFREKGIICTHKHNYHYTEDKNSTLMSFGLDNHWYYSTNRIYWSIYPFCVLFFSSV